MIGSARNEITQELLNNSKSANPDEPKTTYCNQALTQIISQPCRCDGSGLIARCILN